MIDCIEEKLNEREAGKTKKVVFRQTKALIGVYMYEYEKEYLTINICKLISITKNH